MLADTDDTKSKDISEPPTSKYVIQEIQLGIWKVFIATQKRAQGLWSEIWETCPLIIRLVADIHKLAPRLLYLLLLSKCWNGIKLALDMRFENMLLTQIERAVATEKADIYPAIFAICGKVMNSIINSYVRWSDESVMPKLQSRLDHHFQVEIMKAKLMKDLPTSSETSERDITSNTALSSLQKLFDLLQIFFEISSQLLLLIDVSRMKGGQMLFAVFFLQTLMARFTRSSLWELAFFTYISSDDYKRVQSLGRFADGSFRQDIISIGLGDWIVAEYKKAFAAIGDTPTEDLYLQYRKKPLRLGISQEILSEIPSIYFALIVLHYPRHLSIASIATLQSSGRMLFYYVRMFLYEIEHIREGFDALRKMYAPKSSNVIKDGALAYPCPENEDTGGSKGMSFVLKDVKFAYPTGGKKTEALKGIDLDIKAGQLIVVVGANGSGKSTLTRILARLYDPSSGQLLVDGRPSSDYRITDLHRATALLSQDNHIFPLTLAENIGLGYPEHCSNLEMIKEAAKEGGAAEFIEVLENGYQTMLDSFDNAFHLNLNGDKEHPLWLMSDKLSKKKSDISGGQRQRVIAARTFMRFKSGLVKFVIVDEPSSALDADGELQLFQRLMSAREGKTMVFVTHRFGHLTKLADQIICMKDGMVVESGSHGELMSVDGEYAKLYKIQAQAFSEGIADSVSSA